MDAMEPVPPIAQPDAQPATPARGPIARVKGAVGGFFAGGGPDASSQVMVTNPPGEIAPATPGLQPRPDTTPTAVVPSPWANPDAAAAAVPPSLASIAEPTFRAAPVAEPTAIVPALPEDPFAPKAATEPVAPAPVKPTPVNPTPEPTVLASPVWEKSATGSDSIIVEPDMRPSSAPSVESTIPTPESPKTPEDAGAIASEETHVGQEATPEPPMFRKVVDGDLIRYEFTPEGRERLKGAFTKAVEEGVFDNVLGPIIDRPESPKLDSSAKPTELQPTTPTTELPPPPAEAPLATTSPFNSPTPGGTI